MDTRGAQSTITELPHIERPKVGARLPIVPALGEGDISIIGGMFGLADPASCSGPRDRAAHGVGG